MIGGNFMLRDNNARTGFTLQKLICDKYGITPNSAHAINQFNASFDPGLKMELLPLIDDIFNTLNMNPIECTTFDMDEHKRDVPYNFILSDNSTLSIRTNIKGSKVAPRVVGQAGFEKLNLYFKNIYGKEIKTKDDIKKLIYDDIDKCLPIFFEHLFDADYILWIYNEDDIYKYHLIKGDSGVDIDYDRAKFTFTRSIDEWVESNTLKYLKKSIAEIQVHKERTFKFRFIMKAILPYLIAKQNNTETLGITAEKTICDIFNLEYPKNFFKRYSVEMQYQMQDTIRAAFEIIPYPIKHSGSEQGKRGGTSKCSYDFILKGNKTLSLKTNIGKMVCPPEVGQPNDKTAYLYFGKLIDDDHIDKYIFKKMVYDKIEQLLPIYMEHMFDSDYLLRIYENKNNPNGIPYDYAIYEKDYGIGFKWDINKISFSKTNIEEWNESNTLYYDGVSIGEFQVHNNRNCFKFRFNFVNLMKIIRNK